MKQLGLDMMFTDSVTQEIVPWGEVNKETLSTIRNAPWKAVDTETTGLNPASKEKTFSGKDYRRGIDPTLRTRVITVLVPTLVGRLVLGFDLDKLTNKQKKDLANACLTEVVICHNAGFDGYWLRKLGEYEAMPKLLLDSMLIARVKAPHIPVLLAKMCGDEELDFELRQAAEQVFLGGRSGFSLADIVLALFHELVDKGLQGPKNWAEPFLDQKSYNYATGDVLLLDRIMCHLFDVPSNGDWLAAYYEERERIPALKIIEPQVQDVIVMREHGMPWLVDVAETYIKEQIVKVRGLVNDLVEMEPTLLPHRNAIESLDQGINAELKKLIGEAFSSRGLELEMTEKTGTFKIGEKDLRRAKAQINEEAKKLFDCWVGINRAKKAAGMAKEVSGFAIRSGDGRLHPNTGHGPITGRLSSSEPNCFWAHTEILTTQGWKFVSELTADDVVAQITDNGEMEFVKPSHIVNEYWEGQAVQIEMPGIGFKTVVTPNHNLVWNSHFDETFIRNPAQFEVYNFLSVHAPLRMYGKDEKLTAKETQMIHDVMEMAIEGQLCNAGAVTMDVGWSEHDFEIFADKIGPDLTLPEIHPNVSKAVLEAVKDRMIHAEESGTISKRMTRSRADRLQEWLLMAGMAYSVVEGKDGLFTLRAVDQTKSQFFHRSRVDYQENVYCVTVPSSKIMVRDNGVPYVSGNCQQFPRDQGFRNCVTARPGAKIVASDYSALDMRVGAALAIRAQQQIMNAYMGTRPVAPDVLNCIERVLEKRWSLEFCRKQEQQAEQQLQLHMEKRDADNIDRKAFWDQYRKLTRKRLLARFSRCYAEVRKNADEAGTPEWGALRNAFSIDGMDIHTWTALSMQGQDPLKMFGGLSNDEVAAALKKCKKELGDKRQTGKVGNLSLLYAMKTKGLVDAAAKNYNIHWTFEEGDKVRLDWLAAYVEIDLWHLWTELNPFDSVYIPDVDRGGKYAKKDVYASETLGQRIIYAFSINAALSYEDQSTGADILGRVMQTFRMEHPDIYETIVNQVHDEIVFEVPDEVVEEMTDRIGRVMKECSEHYLMKYGVKGECSPAVGQVWLKD